MPQELGTSRMLPRPFLAPVAAGMGEAIARSVGDAVAAALRGDAPPSAIILASASSTDTPQPVPYNPLRVFVPGSPENEAWTSQTIDALHGLSTILHAEGSPDAGKTQPDSPAPAKPGNAVMDDEGRNHILDGKVNDRGQIVGGHGPGRNTPGKSSFPSGWSDEETIERVIDVANDPESRRDLQPDGRTIVTGTRDGLDIRVVIETDGQRIVTAYPTNVPRNPR